MEAARDSSEGDIFRAFEAGMHIYLATRDYAQLFSVGEQALRLLRPSKDVFGLAAIMYALGCSFSLQSYHAHARDYFDQAAAQCRAVGDVQGLVLCLIGCGASSSELGENEKGLQVSATHARFSRVFLHHSTFDFWYQFLREALHICCRAGDAASECIVRTALCSRVIDSGDAKDALVIGQDGQAAALRLLAVAGSGRRHPSCWGLDPIHVASQLEACIRRAKSLVQASRIMCTCCSACINAIALDSRTVSLVCHFPPLHLQQISFSASPASRSRGITSPPAHSTPRSPASTAAATPRRGHPSPSADDFSFRVLVPAQAASHFNFLSQVMRIYLL